MRVACALLVVLGCGGKDDESKRRAPTPDPEPTLAPVAKPDFPEGTRSLEMTRTVGVRLEPGDDAKRIGTIAVDTRVAWTRTAEGKGCKKPWVEIRPRGWVCSEYMKLSTKAPFGREVPMLDRGELVPGVYGKVTWPNQVTYTVEKPDKKKKPAPKPKGPITAPSQVAEPAEPKLVEGKPLVGSINVRQYEEITVGGRQFWRISRKEPEYVLRAAIAQHRPSGYAGARLGDETGWAMPASFIWPRFGWQTASTMYQPNGAGGVARQLRARTPIQILQTASDKNGKPTAYRIGEYEWIRAADVRVFQPAPPPPYMLPDERWIDVDLDTQILVAYEGQLAVYATMVSSGTKDYPTETGVYRMWLKESESDMNGLSGEDPYSVATVPWTQFYSPEKGLALHSAYWHDGFGTRKSRGCLNMAPRDARWLYFWSDPQVPPGWTMAAGVVEAPGSLVRVRSQDDPEPEARGYAKKVIEARQQNAPVE